MQRMLNALVFLFHFLLYVYSTFIFVLLSPSVREFQQILMSGCAYVSRRMKRD